MQNERRGFLASAAGLLAFAFTGKWAVAKPVEPRRTKYQIQVGLSKIMFVGHRPEQQKTHDIWSAELPFSEAARLAQEAQSEWAGIYAGDAQPGEDWPLAELFF